MNVGGSDFFCCHFNGGRLQWWETEKPIWFLFSLQVYFWWCFGAQIAPQPPQIGKHLQVDLPWLCTVRAGHPFFQLANSASIFQKFLRSSASQALWFFSLSRKKKNDQCSPPWAISDSGHTFWYTPFLHADSSGEIAGKKVTMIVDALVRLKYEKKVLEPLPNWLSSPILGGLKSKKHDINCWNHLD